jgi:hypothetical protein
MTDRYPIPDFLHRQPPQAAEPKERPILFSSPMVRAILAGTKTQTRRYLYTMRKFYRTSCFHRDDPMPRELPPVGQCWTLTDWRRVKSGDRLYVRENAWQRPERTQKMMREGADTWPPFIYDADYPVGLPWEEIDNLKTWEWKRRPSIHLPRRGSRILLEIVDVRVERLQDISEADALAEGITEGTSDFAGCFSSGTPAMSGTTAKECYARLWDEINGKGAWKRNDFVWVISFRKVKP